jgi:glycosidase
MLDFAINHTESLNTLFRESYLDPKYYYANCSSFAELEYTFDKNTWSQPPHPSKFSDVACKSHIFPGCHLVSSKD